MVFRSLFGGRKKKSPPRQEEDTLANAGVGDVVVIGGFASNLDDAYFLIEARNRYEAATGAWRELVGADGGRRVCIEHSGDDASPFISVSEYGAAMGLASIGVDESRLIEMDEQHSIDNFIEYEGERYNYTNSQEVFFFADERGEGEGYYGWEFVSRDRKKMLAVVKWEGAPFEVYASVVVEPSIVSVYRNVP